jgi:2-methylaconitate cis-trans-isomerase PrpF/predicted TIM-barrel fold metal-dependent hydrolase
MSQSIPYMQIRGGSSKGVYFKKEDLPTESRNRDEIILDIVGRDARQIDGLGGANPLTSKVAVISVSTNPDADIDFLFVQVVVGENRIDISPNCGNILAGVGAFALESKMINIASDVTKIKVNMLNSNKICELILQTPNGELTYSGNAKIDGVPGTSAPIICNYMDLAGSICGSLFPTKNKSDVINTINVTCIDNGMPVVLLKAGDFGKSGYESCDALNSDTAFKEKLEAIRLKAGDLMGLGNVKDKVIPKMTLISAPKDGGDICTRTFIPHNCHSSIGVLGAVSVASACLFDEAITKEYINLSNDEIQHISVEHPSGEFSVSLECAHENGALLIKKAGLLRTARLLSKGEAYLHDEIINLKEKGDNLKKKSCMAPDKNTKTPTYIAPKNACDAHCHIFGPHALFPYSDKATYWPPDAPEADLRKMHDTLGIQRAVLVQASCHGTDNTAMVDAIKKSNGRYKGVCIADDTFTDADFKYLDDNGVKGVRFNFVAHLGGAPDLEVMEKVINKVIPLGWHLVIHVNAEDIIKYADFFAKFDLPIVVDHMGRVPTSKGVAQEAYQILLDFMKKDNWWVKICGSERISAAGAPFYDAIPYAQGLVAVAPERILWGTDYPHPNIKEHMPNDADLLDLIPLITSDPLLQKKILVDNPARLYGFED